MVTPDKICIQLIGSQFVLLPCSEVLYLEANRQVCHIMLTDGGRLTASRHLGFYKTGLLRDYRFVEVSKSMLINAQHIRRFSPRERLIQLTTGISLPVAKSKQEPLSRLFRDWHEAWTRPEEAG
ncbi:MAG: LytTR family transcriptional regulator DNA-binding domain-containing protein [Saprospiraceae bacterium]|nr:LytTR family transcriptional regulator DNA-binding domain-containing protein [Saprospiraceae bacterium]